MFSASALLDMVVPRGLEQRAALGLKDEDDPVHRHLWDLTMKLRENATQAQELLQHNVLDRLLTVLRACNLSQYNKTALWLMDAAGLRKTTATMMQTPTAKRTEQAEQLVSSIKDTYFVISVFHELCRYRSGCVAVAEHKSVVAELLSIPTDGISITASVYAAHFAMGAAAVAAEKVSPLELLISYHPGMIDQGLLDTMGRLVNGLDQHQSLRNKICAHLSRQFDSLEKKMGPTEKVVYAAENPSVGHCINIQHTLKKLRKLISHGPDETTKAWSSTFRVERHHLPLKTEPKKPEPEEAGNCHFCGKRAFPLQRCARW